MELKTLVFEKAGPRNTDATLQIARERALALGIQQVVVASSHGDTARKAYALFAPEGVQVVAVSICHGYESQGWTMSAETRAELAGLGVVVHTGVHALGDGVGAAFSEKYGGRAPEEIVRDTLYRFSQGMKVAVDNHLVVHRWGDNHLTIQNRQQMQVVDLGHHDKWARVGDHRHRFKSCSANWSS